MVSIFFYELLTEDPIFFSPHDYLTYSPSREKHTHFTRHFPWGQENYPGFVRQTRHSRVCYSYDDKFYRGKTIKQYSNCYKKWWDYCLKHKISPYTYDKNVVLKFLLSCFNEGLSYSSINTYRSSIALILTFSPQDGNTIKRFFKRGL